MCACTETIWKEENIRRESCGRKGKQANGTPTRSVSRWKFSIRNTGTRVHGYVSLRARAKLTMTHRGLISGISRFAWIFERITRQLSNSARSPIKIRSVIIECRAISRPSFMYETDNNPLDYWNPRIDWSTATISGIALLCTRVHARLVGVHTVSVRSEKCRRSSDSRISKYPCLDPLTGRTFITAVQRLLIDETSVT